MYQIIDENEQTNFNVNKITPEMLGLQPTTDFAEYANDVIVDEMPEKAKEWKDKGAIGVIEAGQMYAEEFDGTYDNVLTNDMQRDNFLINHPKMLDRSEKVNQRSEGNKNKFISALNKWGDRIYQAQLEQAEQHENIQKPHKDDPNFRYEVAGMDKTGNVVYNEIDLRKQIGFTEGLRNSIESGYSIPFVGGHIKRSVNKKVENISDKISKGEQITQEELDYFNRYRERQYEKQIRGYNIGGTIGESWLPSMLAFGAEMYTGGIALKAIGLAGKGQAVGSAISEGLTKVNKLGEVGEKIAKGTGFATGEVLEGGLNALVGGSIAGTVGGEFWASYNERRLNDKIKITDRGTVIFSEAKEAPATAFLKSMQSVYLSFFTESMGTLIGAGLFKPLGKLANKTVNNRFTSAGAEQFARVLEHCPKLEGFIKKSSGLLSKAYEKLNKIAIKGKNAEWLKSAVKFDGFLEELGEEVLEDVLNLTLGTNNEERSLENYIKAIFKSPDEWAVLAGTIALQGGTLSIAGNLLGDAMQRNGIPEDKIIEVLMNSTEAEKIELNDGLVKNNSIQVRELTPEDRARANEIKEQIYEQLVNANIDEQEANNISIIAGSTFERYGTQNEESRKIFNDFIDKLQIKYNIPAENYKVNLFQSAMRAGINPQQKVQVIDLSNKFTTDSNLSKDELINFIKGLIGTNLASKDKKAIFNFISRSKRIGKRDVFVPAHIAGSSKVETKYKKERNIAVNNIIDLIKNSILIDVSKNKDKKTKPNVDNYLRFYTPVRIGNNIFTVRITAENNKNKDLFNVLNADVYDVIIDKKMMSSSTFTDKSGNLMKTSSTNSINDNAKNFNPDELTIEEMLKDVVDSDGKIYFQEVNESESEPDEKFIAGYTFDEVLRKYSELQEKLGDEKLSKEEKENINEKINILEEAFDIAQNPTKFSNEDRRIEVMLNAYYIMNNQEIPDNYVDTEKKSAKNWNDYVKIHNEKKEQKEAEYYGYFTEGQNANVITIMQNHNSSTALHEFGHLFLEMLNELAKVNEDAKEQVNAVNKWLGSTGEYTVAQHEKFANNFVAYLYKGKAPNAKLKKVFEDFKEWLKSVYAHVLDIPNVDISEEVQEMFDNIFGSDSYYQEKKQVNELLKRVKQSAKKERVKNIATRASEELDETAKRHKEIAYQILSAGTGKSVKYLKTIFETSSNKQSFGKKREAIQELLDKVDDKITVSGGMREEWREFFTDTGVSYDTDETDGDFKLVEQALDVIINKSYGTENIENELDERAKYYEKAIDEADREYKILLRSYKKENRNVALSAIYEWLEGLDAEIKQDYEDRFIYDSGIIERKENVDKFDKAKRQILHKAMELQNPLNINKDENYQELVKEIMRNLDFLQPQDKARLTANILDVPSTDFLMSSLDNIMDIAKTMEDVNFRRKLESEIHKELQGTKNVKRNGRSEGRYNYKTNKIFEKLRELDRLSPEKALDLINDFRETTFEKAEQEGLSYEDRLVNMFLSYKAGGRTFADTDLMKNLYDEIVKIKLIGKSAKSELELQEKLSDENEIENLIDIVQNKKGANIFTKAYNAGFSNLESVINLLFNKNVKEKYATEILYSSTLATTWAYEKKKSLTDRIAEIYNLPAWNWDRKILEYLSQEFTYPEIRRKYDVEGNIVKSRIIDRTMTKMDIINAYIQSKNEVGEKRLINQFGEDTLYSMFDELSLDDVKLAEALMDAVQSSYDLVNQTYQRKYGLDLPQVSNYFPFTPERGTEVQNFNEYVSQSYSFTKARAQSEFLPMDFHNPVQIAFSHIDNVSKFVLMSEQLDKANRIFLNNDLKRAIINKYGEGAYKTLEQLLVNVSCRKSAEVYNGIDKVVNTMSNNWLGANMAVKPSIAFKQLLSANNYGVDMPSMKWRIGFFNAIMNYKDTIDYMMKIPYLRARFGGGFSNEALKQTIENSAFANTKSLKNFLALNIKLGDIGAIIFGGKPYIDYLIEQGMDEEDAIKQFVLSTNRSQQSSEIASLSNFQVNASRNPFMRVITAYRNAQQQYVRMCGDALVSVANGDMTKQQCAKVIFQYAFYQPFIYTMAGSGSLLTLLFTGDPEDLLNDIKTSLFNLGSDSLAVIGDAYKYAMQRIFIKDTYTKQSLEIPMFSDLIREINKIAKEDSSLKDYLSFAGYLGGKMSVGVDVSNVLGNMVVGGVADILDGNVMQGLLRMYGMSEKRAKHITGNE